MHVASTLQKCWFCMYCSICFIVTNQVRLRHTHTQHLFTRQFQCAHKPLLYALRDDQKQNDLHEARLVLRVLCDFTAIDTHTHKTHRIKARGKRAPEHNQIKYLWYSLEATDAEQVRFSALFASWQYLHYRDFHRFGCKMFALALAPGYLGTFDVVVVDVTSRRSMVNYAIVE